MTKKNTAATVVTIIVAVLAIATTLFLLYQMSQKQTQDTRYSFVPSEEVNNEMIDNATTLVKNNCEVFRIFMQYGLPHKEEPYNNVPEDGFYTVKSDDYKTMADLENLVNSTFVDSEAQRILTNVNGNGAVYAEETDNEGNKGIGLSADMVDSNGRFKAYDYGYSWTNANVSLSPKSNTECDIIIELAAETDGSNAGSTDSDASVSTDAKTFTVTMLKVNGSWRLQKLAY